nr:Toll/interleukin-1 receptor (TIR) domain-containing protein [Tanacetum cinerariifolium]
MHDPREPHLNAMKHVLCYLRGTTDHELQLFRSTTSQLIAYSDADWADCPATRWSTSGYCVYLSDNLLTLSSKRQDTLSRTSAKAEYREISLDLRSINFSIDEKLVGMGTRVKGVVSSLETSAYDFRVIWIKGIGGGGKTTLARAVFDQISVQFEGKSFVENVREISKGSLYSLKSLQKQVLSDVLNDLDIIVRNVYDGKNMMKQMLCRRKVLLVLDDVDQIDQLEALVGQPNWYKSGSRIIITTRDEQVLITHGVNLIWDVNLLSLEEAICLFCRYAFGREVPIQGCEELSREVVHYASGLPLTIKVLGSLLCEEDYEEIFLDIAYILKGWKKEKAIKALESCGFHARNGLRVLEQKSLITISKLGYLDMHDHIEEMGKNIVRRLHPDDPNKYSRLWIDEEIEDILANNLGEG